MLLVLNSAAKGYLSTEAVRILNSMKIIKTFSHSWLLLGLGLALVLVNTAAAQNRVVVIPLGGDDVSAELTPTTPVAKVNTEQGDYTIMNTTVIDTTTQLEWQRQDDDIRRNWDEAWDYCAGLDLASHQDWRLPRIKELQSIVDYGQASAPLIERVAFTNTNSGNYWSASSRASTSSSAWVVDFNSGAVTSSDLKTFNFFVRCVR